MKNDRLIPCFFFSLLFFFLEGYRGYRGGLGWGGEGGVLGGFLGGKVRLPRYLMIGKGAKVW